ncbi:MAG: HEAT repeat domain-containing protein, partial [Sandaracinaceae bacterium]|nr:HEAT repeat domain-containing protein [Sandaracinaceae bacterium]
PAPRVREQATTALSRLGAEETVAALTLALDDVDPLIQERAAEGLLSRERTACTARVLELVSRTPDHDIAIRLAARIALPDDAPAELIGAIGDAIERVGPEHSAYELLLDLKIRALERLEPAPRSEQDVDAVIASLFPKWPRLSAVRGFAPLARSLRTAETLYRVTGETRSERGAARQADESGPIVLWAKCLEGYLHAWLSPRLGALQQKPSALFGLVDKITGSGWPAYQRWLGGRWADPVDVGGLSIELPLRSAINALRDLSEHRLKSLSAPLAITEWARMMLFLAVDHPSGPRNVLAIACEDPERAVELSHRLQVLAQVRNTVTHRSVASRATLESFRALYYPTFEALTEMA